MKLSYTGTNLGSLCKIEIVSTSDVESEPEIIAGVATGALTLKPGKTWEEIYFTDDTAHFVERAVVMEGSEFFQLKVKWKAPKDSQDSTKFLVHIRKHRFIARLTEVNGPVLLVGSIKEPCRIHHTTKDLGQNARDSNYYQMELDLTRAIPAAHITI